MSSIGQPLDNCAVYLLDSDKKLVEIGEIGEVYVAGSHICSGYVRNREMERFVNNHIDNTTGVSSKSRFPEFISYFWASLFHARIQSHVSYGRLRPDC